MNILDRIKVGAVGFFKLMFGKDGFAAKAFVIIRLDCDNLRLRCLHVYHVFYMAFLQFRIRQLERRYGIVLRKPGDDISRAERSENQCDLLRSGCEKRHEIVSGHCGLDVCLLPSPNSLIEQRAA